MKEMNLRQFAAHLTTEAGLTEARQLVGMQAAGVIVKREAVQEIGHYQGAIGPFAAWPQLQPDTQADRVAKGYTPNDPLLRRGDLRASIDYRADARTLLVGSDEKIALWQEMGTRKGIPPRPFLGGAMVRKTDAAIAAVAAAVFGRLGSGRRR